MIPQFFTQIVKAGLAAMVTAPGKVLTVKTITGPTSIALDGKQAQPVNGGAVLVGPFSIVNIFNTGSVDSTITFFVGDEAVQFQPGDNSQSNASHTARGNLGVAFGAGAVTGLPACDANGWLQVTTAGFAVAGTLNAHRRQSIVFSVNPNSAFPLLVLDSNGFLYMRIYAGQQIDRVTDAAFTIKGDGGTASATVGEIFLTS